MTIMITLAVSALILRVVIEQVIRINLNQNESSAQGTLKLVSTALENYAKNHQGVFPTDFADLVESKPAYLDRDYISDSPLKGYNYNCSRIEPAGYSCSAAPVKCKLSGRFIYTVTTGGLLIYEKCDIKE